MFFGTPTWAVPSLRALVASEVDVAAVITNPDRPAGRGLATKPSPVKVAAREQGLEVLELSARDPDLRDALGDLGPDVGVVVAYGGLLPPELLSMPERGFVNLHFSLLPAYRGAAPVQRALVDGATETGVSVMVLTEGMDEGPVLAATAVGIEPRETAGELGGRLAELGAALLVEAVESYVRGELDPEPQDHSRASYAPKISGEEARVDWIRPAGEIHDQVRGLNPRPGAWTTLRDQRLKLWRVEVGDGETDLAPGELRSGAELEAGSGAGWLALSEVQLAGRRRMTGTALARGLRLGPGDRLG